jgi:hypothetical protein
MLDVKIVKFLITLDPIEVTNGIQDGNPFVNSAMFHIFMKAYMKTFEKDRINMTCRPRIWFSPI